MNVRNLIVETHTAKGLTALMLKEFGSLDAADHLRVAMRSRFIDPNTKRRATSTLRLLEEEKQTAINRAERVAPPTGTRGGGGGD